LTQKFIGNSLPYVSMKLGKEEDPEVLRQMRSYVIRQLIGPAAAVAVVAALCWGCGTADDATLTVEQCIGDNATIGPVEGALIKEDIIEENLLETEVTNVVCKDMLKPISGSTPLQKLAAAQRYIQEIKLIEGAMREAAAEQASRATDWYSSSDESLMLFGALAYTSEQVAAQAQYDDAIGGIEPRELQAAAAARVGENNGASIANRVRVKEAATNKAGASVPEARAGARCSTEIEVSDDEAKKIVAGRYEIIPQMPKKIRLGETERAGLLVSPVPQQIFREISQKHDAIEEASKSNFGCGYLTERMQAELVLLDPEALGANRRHPDDIQELSSHQEVKWSWDVNGRQAGNPEVWLDLSYELSPEGQEFRSIPQSPVYKEPIRVTAQPWWQRIFGAYSGLR
jgi:hypothetical protein